MPKVQTACPNCGESPIPEGVEQCPHCRQWIHAAPVKRRTMTNNAVSLGSEEDDDGATSIGGADMITSSVEAHPAAAVALLGALAAHGALAGLGVLHAAGPAPAYLALAGLDVLAAALLLSYRTVGRSLALALLPLQAVAQLALNRAAPLEPGALALALAPLAGLLAVAGEPGPARRAAGAAAGLGLVALGVLVTLGAGPALVAHGSDLLAPRAGLEARLPPDCEVVGALDKAARYQPLAEPVGRAEPFAFVCSRREVGGAWLVAPSGSGKALAGEVYAALGGPVPARAAPVEVVTLRLPQATYLLPPSGGRAASVTGFDLPDGRAAALLLAAPANVPGLLDQVRLEVARETKFPVPQGR